MLKPDQSCATDNAADSTDPNISVFISSDNVVISFITYTCIYIYKITCYISRGDDVNIALGQHA